MCGIAGFLDARAGDPAGRAQLARAMADRLLHRGPDAAGQWAEGPLAFGHRRLSILDLSAAGAQPMQSVCGRFAICYNGEIYNHLELRRELEASGLAPPWRGHSDTETLLAAIAAWGLEATLGRTAGMFALALWDRREQRLFLARDRMGEKPLYYGWAGPAFVFASELKAIAAHPDFVGEVDRGVLAQFLRFTHVPAPRSIWRRLFKLEPGCLLMVDGAAVPPPLVDPLRPGERAAGLAMDRWWSLAQTVEAGLADPLGDETEALDRLEAALSAAIRRQMLSDVPLGAFLSGGIDSSLVVALMQKAATAPVRTFTIGFENPAYDESGHAGAVARHLGTDHHALRVTGAEAREVIPDLPLLYDEPFGDSSQIPTHLVSRLARGQVAVALSGDGGDELFGGYYRYFLVPRVWSRLGRVPFALRRAAGAGLAALPLSVLDRLGAVFGPLASGTGAVGQPGAKLRRLGERLAHVRDIDGLYLSLLAQHEDPRRLLAGGADVEEPATLLGDPLPVLQRLDPAARMMVHDARTYLPDDILVKVDRAAMAVSLETRVPMLDPQVIALAWRLPMDLRIRRGESKWVLRQLLDRHVPRALVDRPKTGFGIPVGAWIRGPLRDWAEDLLAADRLQREGFLDPAAVRQQWDRHLAGDGDFNPGIWALLMFQAWVGHWQAGGRDAAVQPRDSAGLLRPAGQLQG